MSWVFGRLRSPRARPHPQPLSAEEKLAEAKKLLGLPPIVVICGSTRFMTEMAEADLRETKAGKIVLKPCCDRSARRRAALRTR